MKKQKLEKMHNLSEVRDAMRFKSNRSLKDVCKRYRVPILNVSRQTKLMRHSDYLKLLERMAKAKG